MKSARAQPDTGAALTEISSTAFQRNLGGTLALAREGPLVITSHGRREFVVLTHAAWEALQRSDEPPAAKLDHPSIDRRSLAMHRLIAQKVRANPRLLDIARANLERWRATADRARRITIEEWERILARPFAELIDLMCEDSEEGARRRQSNPFAGILSNRERLDFLRAWHRDSQ